MTIQEIDMTEESKQPAHEDVGRPNDHREEGKSIAKSTEAVGEKIEPGPSKEVTFDDPCFNDITDQFLGKSIVFLGGPPPKKNAT
jgi:hypothetical protein